MNRRRRIFAALAFVVVSFALALGYFDTRGSASSATAGPSLTSITPSQLKAIGIALDAPTTDAPEVSKTQATTVAAENFPGKILEAVHATCIFTVGTLPDTDCWVVVPDPTADRILLLGPEDGPAQYAGVDYEVGIVDASTGKFLLSARQGLPPN
jgi:hypothetical protein